MDNRAPNLILTNEERAGFLRAIVSNYKEQVVMSPESEKE